MKRVPAEEKRIMSKEVIEDCDCCNGKGLVTTDFVDDWSPCMNCNGTGKLKYNTDDKPEEEEDKGHVQ